MKKAILFVFAAVVGAGAAFGGILSDDPGELTVSGQYWFPGAGDTDLFDSGMGATVSYREWFSFPWGVGVNLGLAQWQVDSGSRAFKYDMLTDYDGDALLIPLGLSLYFNAIDWDNWNLVLDTGLQYVFVDSNVSVYNNEATDLGVKGRQDVDIGGAVLWNIGAEYEYMVSENIYVLGGLGFQTDMVNGDTDYAGGHLRDASFAGFYARLGAKLLF
jgi:hypothetical protein